MITDIVGYSTLMGKDRDQAYRILDKNRQCQKPLILEHNGKFIKELGDGILSTFPTASDAVECAIEIQKTLLEETDFKIRIAIHMGEVEFTDDDVLGEGVNVTSRIEQLSLPQGIYISETVNEQVKNHHDIRTTCLGDVSLKNIDSRVLIYTVNLDFLPEISRSTFRKVIRKISSSRLRARTTRFIVLFIVLALITYLSIFLLGNRTNNSDQKSLAVLPFQDLSEDQSNLYFSLGITEDLMVELSKIKGLKVIDRSNLRDYNITNKSYSQIGKDLHVSNLLIGGIRKNNEDLRISARLIHLPTEEQLWGNVYNKKIQEVITIQSEIASSIAKALEVNLSKEEISMLHKPASTNVIAYDLYLQGREYYRRYTIQDLLSAIELYNSALQIDPDFILAHAGLSDAFCQIAMRSKNEDIWTDSAYQHARIARERAPDISDGYKSMGLYYSIKGNITEAINEYKKAVEIDNNNEAAINLSRIYYKRGELVESLRTIHRIQWNNPLNADMWYNIGAVYYRMSEFTIALDYCERALTMNPNHINALLLKWWIAVLSRRYQTADEVTERIGFVSEDNSKLMLSMLGQAFNNDQTNLIGSADALEILLMGHEADYIDMPYIYNLIGFIYFKGNKRDKAIELFDYKRKVNMEQLSAGEIFYDNAYEIAQTYAIKKDTVLAIQWLEKAYQYGWPEYSYASLDPLMKPIHTSNEYNTIVKNTKDRVDKMKTQLMELEIQ
jgi:TolB-like protein